MAKFDMYDAWHKMDDDYVSGVDLQAKGQEQLSNTKVNPLHDLAESVTEWIEDMDKAGQKLAVAAGEAYKTGNFDAIDDMALPDVDASSPSPAQEKVAQALQDAVDDARYVATKDPLTLIGDVAGAASPWIPLAVQVPIMVHEMQKAQEIENAPEMSDQAKASLLPMMAGTVAASVTHGVGGLLSKAAPKVSKVMTTPFVGSGIAAGTVLAMDENVCNYAAEHPARFAVSQFLTDTAIGAKKLAKADWSAKTNPVTDAEIVSEKTNPATEVMADKTKVDETNKKLGSPTKEKNKRKRKHRKQHRENVWDVDNDYEEMVTPAQVTKREPKTTAEKAYPEQMPEQQMQQDAIANQLATDHIEARQTPEIMQGAFGDELKYSKDNLYPHPVSAEDIWETAKAMFPIRPGRLDLADSDRTLGYFMPQGKGIRIRGFRAWSVICHEIGHGLSDKFGWGKDTAVQKELYDGATSIWQKGEYGNKHAPENYATYVEEGRAAFMNEYCVNPEMAKKHFPLAYAEFEKAIASDRFYQAQMNLLGQQVRRWGSQSDFSKAAGMFHWADKELGKRIDKLIGTWTATKKHFAWEYADLDESIRAYEDNQGVKIAMENDPAVLAQYAKQAGNDTVGCLLNGNNLGTRAAVKMMQTKFNIALNNVVATDILKPLDVQGKRGAELQQWLKDTGYTDFYEAFNTYQTAKHELEVMGTGRKTTHTYAECKKIIAKAEELPEMKLASDLWKQWNENVLRIAVAGQILPREVANKFLKEYPEYIPMTRSFEIEGTSDFLASHKAMTVEGSERIIKDPLVQAVKNMQSIVTKVERNRVGLALADLAKGEKGHFLMMPVKDGKYKHVSQIITVYEEGHPKYYQCMMKGLYEAMTSEDGNMSASKLDIIEKISHGAATALRIGSTSTPMFATANLCKDILEATIMNADGRSASHIPLVAPMKIFWQGLQMLNSDNAFGKLIIRNNRERALLRQYKREFRSNGVTMSTRLGSIAEINKDFRKIVDPNISDSVLDKILYPIKVLWNWNLAYGEAMEQLPRMALYRRAKGRGASMIEAAMVASDSTLNFAKSGTTVKILNRHTPFLNAAFQGTLKTARELSKNPLSVGLAMAEHVLFPTLLLWYWNKDEDWYKDMPMEMKNKAWYIKIGDTIYDYPKPTFIGQLAGSIPERLLDVMAEGEDKQVIADAVYKLIKDLAPSGAPPIIEKFYEWQTNHSMYRNRPLVDQRLEKLSPKNQYNQYTSMVARGIGQVTNLSPIKIDNTIYGLTGSMGYTFMNAVDMVARDNITPNKKWTEYTRFTYTEGTGTSRSKDVFFGGLDKLETQYADASFEGRKPKVDKELKGMRKARADAMKVSKAIRELYADKTMDADTKRTKLDELNKKQNSIFRTANKKYLNYKYIQVPK